MLLSSWLGFEREMSCVGMKDILTPIGLSTVSSLFFSLFLSFFLPFMSFFAKITQSVLLLLEQMGFH